MARILAQVLVMTAAFPFLAAADTIYLKGGGRVEGQVVEQTADRVVVEVSAGQVTLPRTRIERMTLGSTALVQYRARAARLAPNDAAGWLALADWASGNDLATPARLAYEHVLQIEPMNGAAHQALGHVFMAGRWLTANEGYRARGYIEFEGGWVRPEEHQAILQERAVRAAESRASAESDARVREAEARARTAEAEARRVEAEAAQATAYGDGGGIPFPYVYGGGYGGGYGGAYVNPLPIDPDPSFGPPPVVVVTPQQRPQRDYGSRDGGAGVRTHHGGSGGQGGVGTGSGGSGARKQSSSTGMRAH